MSVPAVPVRTDCVIALLGQTDRDKARPASALGKAMRIGVAGLAVMLASCGGGGGGGGDSAAPAPSAEIPTEQTQVSREIAAPTDEEAHRFLVQATFGPTPLEVARVKEIGYDAWIDEQYAMSMQTTHVQSVEASSVARNARADAFDITYSWWTHAVRDPAQLRQRVAFALSEIFVVSTMTLDRGRLGSSYLDMLTEMSGANYRDVLEAVAMHPAMGAYLSHISNRKEDARLGRVPDENFAREVMQLFSIGLYELEDTGRPKLVNGQPVETYNADDIKGLARVFTGFGWYRPADKMSLPWWNCFWSTDLCRTISQEVTRMTGYTEEHEAGAKTFLGVTVPARATASPQESLRIALDRLASHANTAPFISKQLIQRLVTSNPSDAYVRDITQVFRATNGNLKAVVKAILLHEQARSPELTGGYGKLREPVIRFTNLMRALPHSSGTFNSQTAAGLVGYYQADDTNDSGTGLGQTPLRAPSVFNFFRPGYKPPQTELAQADLVAPEMQITSETSVLGYANYVAFALASGWGRWNPSIQNMDMKFDLTGWHAQADRPAELLDTLSLRLLGHMLPTASRQEAIQAITAMPLSTTTHRQQRVQAAILMIAVSPDFIIQQ